MSTEKTRRPSPLQRRILVVLAALDANRPGPVATRDLGRLLEQGADAPVYGPNLRASCRRLEDAGWLRTLRAPNLQLAVELTDAGRDQAAPLLQAEVNAQERTRRESTVCALTSLPGSAADVPANVRLNGQDFLVRSAAYVVRLDGTTCLQLELPGGALRWLPADALQVAEWYQACVRAGLPSRVQVNADAPAAGAGEDAR
ncbi:hypothetical protein [Enterobacter cancerogenus]|uniref:hypothetical protein n=1 Tax=Enterobacter cancerogenus TaxID=69218 RepID=UPI0005367F08|nr:hypothetical protein [Enterobacter cancerogenus]KGT88794.1 hypothetical protein NH00_17580 [Enterobacter cancerogenus]